MVVGTGESAHERSLCGWINLLLIILLTRSDVFGLRVRPFVEGFITLMLFCFILAGSILTFLYPLLLRGAQRMLAALDEEFLRFVIFLLLP